MKKIIYILIISLVIVSGLVFANREIKKETPKASAPKPITAAERKAAMEEWEATPEGKMFKQWEASPAGKKVYAGAAKIKKSLSEFSNMEAVVTSLTLPPGSRLGFGIMVRINEDDYILTFAVMPTGDTKNDYEQLKSLKVNDKIIIRSRNVSYAPKYAYPIVAGDYVERDGKLLYKRIPGKGGC